MYRLRVKARDVTGLSKIFGGAVFYLGDPNELKKVFKKSEGAEPGGIPAFILNCRCLFRRARREYSLFLSELCFEVYRSNAMRITARKAQNILEYTMLILIVAAALIAMTTYVTRAMNARLKQSQDELNYYRAD
jgi:Flp pilus assembly pilin Flp